jgi:hypothetical protein
MAPNLLFRAEHVWFLDICIFVNKKGHVHLSAEPRAPFTLLEKKTLITDWSIISKVPSTSWLIPELKKGVLLIDELESGGYCVSSKKQHFDKCLSVCSDNVKATVMSRQISSCSMSKWARFYPLLWPHASPNSPYSATYWSLVLGGARERYICIPLYVRAPELFKIATRE